jgi:hypothetical protein
VNVPQLVQLSRQWLNINFAYAAGEWAYKDVQPKLFCEEYLGTDESCPIDYKFFCFAGKVQFIQGDFDRHTAHTRNIYDCDWNLLDAQYHPLSALAPSVPGEWEGHSARSSLRRGTA